MERQANNINSKQYHTARCTHTSPNQEDGTISLMVHCPRLKPQRPKLTSRGAAQHSSSPWGIHQRSQCCCRQPAASNSRVSGAGLECCQIYSRVYVRQNIARQLVYLVPQSSQIWVYQGVDWTAAGYPADCTLDSKVSKFGRAESILQATAAYQLGLVAAG